MIQYLIIIASNIGNPSRVRRNASVHIWKTLSARNTPREDSNYGTSGHQRRTVITSASSASRLVVRADVRVLNARPIRQTVTQAARCGCNGCNS